LASERLVGEFLKIHHTIARKRVDRIPGLVVKLYPLARDPDALLWRRSAKKQSLAHWKATFVSWPSQRPSRLSSMQLAQKRLERFFSRFAGRPHRLKTD
jgi:hypothetical protein